MHTRQLNGQPCSLAAKHLRVQPVPFQPCFVCQPVQRAPAPAAAAADSGSLDPGANGTNGKFNVPSSSSLGQNAGLWSKVQEFVLGKNRKLDKQRLAELGMGAFAAYGVISNLNASVLVTLAWLTVVKTKGVTPLAPGMWPQFLVVYGGLWISSHFMRPIRLSLAIAAAPAFDAALVTIMNKTGFNKAGAFGVMLACIFVGTASFLLTILTVFGGFPPTPIAA